MAGVHRKIGSYSAPITAQKGVHRKIGSGYNEINGAAYLGGKVAAGAASIGIGAYNLVAGAWDQLTGNTYRAEKRYAENSATAFSEKLDGMYNANGGMKFAGAVAEGVGQFLPTFALSFIPYVGGALSVGTQFAAYTGMNVEEAYKKTGELGAKEYAYGAALGGFETALEFVGGKVGGWIGGTKVFDVSKGITKGASKAAASAGKLGVSSVGARMLKGGASEFAEEFIESYAEVGLQKALQIDPNASITFQDALYAGAVGFASGGVISGAGSTLNTVGSMNTGKRVMAAGEAEMTVAAATEIADSFSPNGKYQAEAVSKLRDNLDLWERTADKTGTQAQMILGNIRTAMTVCEVYAAQSGTYAAVKANPEKFLGYARALFGEQVTVEDLKNPDSTVTRYIAAAEWAGGEVQKLTLRAEKARMAEEVARINEGRSTAVRLSDAEWRGGNAMYDLGNGAYVYVVGRNGNYTLMVGHDTDNVQAFAKADGDTVLTEEEVAQLLGELRGAPMAAPAAPRENGRAPAEEEYDGYFERAGDDDDADGENDGENTQDGENGEQAPKQSLGEDAEQKPPAQNGAAEGAAGDGERKRDTALRRDRRERLLDEYDESVKARAHKLVKRADTLSAERRAALYETVASATGIDDRTLKAALAVEAGRTGLVLYFNREMNERYEGKPNEGAQKVFANGTRLIAVAAGIDGVKQAMVHEIFHDIRASGVGAQLEKFAIATGDAERMERTAKRYTDAFAKRYKTPTLAEFRKAGEYKTLLDLVYAYDAKYKEQLKGQSLAEEVAAREIGEKLGTKRFLRRLAISEAMANKPGLVRRIFARFKGTLARFDWQVGRDHVAAMERAYLLACKEAPVMQAIRELRGASARSGSVFFSIKEKDRLNERSRSYYDGHPDKNGSLTPELVAAAEADIDLLADEMLKYMDILNNEGRRYLPEEVLGNTVFKNGSYGRTMENTSICYRTLAYNDFVDEVKKQIGRPLTVKESFLASQMLYEIAKEPQCLYCYVSLDRKAYDEQLLSYLAQRDEVLRLYADSDKSAAAKAEIYGAFLRMRYDAESRKVTSDTARKDTAEMKSRFYGWLKAVDSGERLITYEDLATAERRSKIIADGGAVAGQMLDAEKYAQAASWAKKSEGYRSYNGELLRMGERTVKNLNAHYGLRFYSFSEYTAAFIVENMQQIRDASLRGLKGLAYTKKTDFVRIFAPTGMGINVSVFGKLDADGNVVEDSLQGAAWDEVKALRKKHRNVGAVFVATNDALVDWALKQDWIDVVIPFHIVRTGANVAEFYKWTNYSGDQADVASDGKSLYISPVEHNNEKERFLQLCRERGIKPRFSKWVNDPNYMKLVNETRQSVSDTRPLLPVFDTAAAQRSFRQFVREGGYYGNWYREGADYAASVERVAQDVMAGRTAAEVEYGRQDRLAAMQSADRRQNRRHESDAKLSVGEEYAEYDKPITIRDVDILRSIGRQSVNKFSSEERKKARKWAYKFYQELGVKSPFFRAWFGDWRSESIDPVSLPDIDSSAIIKAGNEINADTRRKISWNPESRKESILNAPKQYKNEIGIIAANMSEIVKNAVLLDTFVSEKKSERKLAGTAFMHSFYSLVPIDDHITLVKLFAEEAISPKSGESFTRAYSLKHIEKVAEIDNGVHLNKEGLTESHPTTTYSISDLFGFVKRYDAEFSPKPVNKALLNEDGTPRVFYHGTNQGDFTEFLWEKTQRADGGFYGRGHYFTNSREMAKRYGQRVIEAYLSIRNPFIWSEQVGMRNGKRGSNLLADNLIKRINMARIFPTLFADKTMEGLVYDPNTGNEERQKIKWSELEAKIKEIGDEMTLRKFADGTYKWFVQGRFFEESVGDSYKSADEAEADKFSAAAVAFSERYQGIARDMSFDDLTTFVQRNGDEITALLKKAGYDGAMQNAEGDEVVAFESAQIKSATDNIGTYDGGESDTRFALGDEAGRALTRGEVARRLADAKRWRVYDRREIDALVDGMLRDDTYAAEGLEIALHGKDRVQVVEYLWEQANGAKESDMEAVYDRIADFVLNRAIVERVELNAYEQADLEAAQATYRVLAGYRRRLDLTSLKAEILHKYDKRGKKSVLARWHKPGGLTVDAVAADINEQLRAEGSALQLTEDAHPSEILSQIIDGFDKAVYTVKEQFATENALQFESEAERNAFRDLVKKRLFEGVKNGGRESAHARFVKNHDRVVLELSKRMSAKAKDLEAATRKQNVYATAILRARELAEMVKQHKYVGAEHLIAPEMKAVGDLLSRTANLRGIKDPAVRKAMRQLAAWYTPQSICPDQVDEKGNVEDGAMFRADIRDAIAALADGEGLLSVSEVKILADILSHIRKIYTEYDRVVIGGKAESLARIAQDQVKLENTYAEWDEKRRRKLVAAWQKVRNGYLFQAMTPRQVIQTLEFFDEKGVLHRLYEDIQAGLARTNSDYADMMTPLVNFLEEHKGYGKRLSKERIEYQGDTLTVGQAIALYLTTYREQAKLGLEETGISYMGKDGKVHKLGGRAVEDIRRDIEGQLNSEDRAYIKVIKKLFARAGEMKVKADTEIFGYTNVEDGFYFPILRDAMGRASKTSDFRQAMRDIAVVANKSFNKDTKQGAKGRLMIGDVTEIANAHVRGVAQYANLFTPLQAFDRVWNKPVEGPDGRTTVREIVNDRIWTAKGERGAADKYLQKLFSDIQEVGVIREVGDDVYSKLRTAYVSAALGLNLSSCLKQFGSYGTALLYLGAGDLAKGAVMKADVAKMRKYSVVANGRLFDRSTVVAAETNVAAGRAGEGLARIQELVTAPVEKTDDFVISRLWNACQLAVQRQQGHALGTEENLTAAGKLLDKVINESQSTNTADTRSGMQRGGKIMQTLTMFTSDAVKSVSYLYEAAMRGYMARQRVKMGIGSDAEVKAAKQFGKRAFAAYLTSMAITVAVIQFIKWLLKKERDEDETLAQDVGGEIAGHMIGMLPLVSDVYSLAKDGYEIESFALDTVNTLVTTAKSVTEMASDAAGGAYVDEKKLATTLKNGVVAVSNLFGIPTRNVHNYTTGLMKRFFGSSTYGYTSLFSAGTYEADLQAAVQAGDEALALRVVQVMAKRQRGGELDSAAAAEILYLYGDGHDVLGGGIPQTYNGTPVNAEQHRAMEAICGKADDAVEALVAGEIYQGLTDEEKARAIYRTYSTYLALAKRDVLGAKGNTATEVMDLIPADVLMAALGRIDLLKGDESSTRAEKVAAYLNTLHLTQEQKYLILYAAGYDNKTVSAAVEKLKKGKKSKG